MSAVKTSSEFICVKGTSKHASLFKVRGAPLVVITDPDGEEIHRASILEGESQLVAAWDAALKKYAGRPVSWGAEVQRDAAGKKVLVVAFDDEKGEGLKVFEDRMLAKYHDKCQFVKMPFVKDGEAAKRWSVTQAPTVFLCDPAKENSEKYPLEKLVGKKSPASIKAALLRAIRKVESAK